MTGYACRACGYRGDEAMLIGGTDHRLDPDAPERGDLDICAGCGHLTVYLGSGMARREITPDEIRALEMRALRLIARGRAIVARAIARRAAMS